ncbi:hypothetical protein T01_14370 [Trichinella spiralis]|uniref:Uncharacterized protein n=1 Tax=Trichinella spiralis TaxID=6334 RepID=A0A0V1AZQ4_TRISP|nr:hypothetical protein T01_14370 [Trichinella spiralis]
MMQNKEGEPDRRLACFDVGQHDVDLSFTLSLSLSLSIPVFQYSFVCTRYACSKPVLQACSAFSLSLFPAFSRFLYFQYFPSTTVGYLLTRVCFSRTKSI